jgi:hypothetical protein
VLAVWTEGRAADHAGMSFEGKNLLDSQVELTIHPRLSLGNSHRGAGQEQCGEQIECSHGFLRGDAISHCTRVYMSF